MASEVVKIAAVEIKMAFRDLDKDDRPRVCEWCKGAMGKIRRGRYGAARDFMTDAKAILRPKARDWQAILDFLNGMLPLIQVLIAMFAKTPSE